MAGNQVVTVKEADGTTETDLEILGMGRQGTAASKSVQLCTEDKAVLDSLATKLDTAITALQIIDNMVLAAGTANIGDVDVLTLPALVAGTANIGDVDVLTLPALPAGTNNIGDVDVLSIVPGTAATNLGKAEDAAHTTGDVGVMALAVRQDTVAALAGTTGDYIPLSTDANGNLRVALPDSQLDGSEYETVAASQTTQSLGATGATGDYLDTLVCVVATAATSQVQIKDGSNAAITVLPNAVGPGVGTYHVSLGLVSTTGAWQITTAAGVSVVATGNFT